MNGHCEDVITLDHNTDCVEWNDTLKVLTLSTYHLIKDNSINKQERIGAVYFYNVIDDQSENKSSKKLQHLNSYDLKSGVFDLKWKYEENNDSDHQLLAIGLSNGDISILNVSKNEESGFIDVNNEYRFPCFEDDDMVLGVDWERSNNSNQCHLATSYQKGAIAVWDINYSTNNEYNEPVWYCKGAHNLEVWQISYMDYGNDSLIMSCSDDCTLKIWDIRSPSKSQFSSEEYTGRCAKTLMHHDAGVTSFISSELSNDSKIKQHLPNVITVGSYDGTVTFWDIRMITDEVDNTFYPSHSLKKNDNTSFMTRKRHSGAKPLKTIDTEGGVWRMKYRPNNNNVYNESLLAMACVYNGFQVWSIDVEGGLIKETKRSCYYEGPHESGTLAYGIDWIETMNGKNYLASCSFYNNKLSIWSF